MDWSVRVILFFWIKNKIVSRTGYGVNNPLCSRYIFKVDTKVFPLKILELTLNKK